ncbi:MAG: glycine cleavage system protein GcvH [Synergistaceae bacterium]|jgi:glycine cleavage system H protein|nr:glycine cleavage system protein GcvH [Synergistaceae bacterium]
MKTFEELDIRKDISYTKTHEWAKKTGGLVRVGVDDYAQSALGDIVYVELPSVGATVNAGAAFGSLESTKAVSDLNSPVTGKVVKINEALADSPETVNSSPYEEGWMIEIEGDAEFDALLKSDAYAEYLKTLD